MRRAAAACALLLAAMLLLAACGSGNPDASTSDIVSAVPWSGSESLRYELRKDGDLKGYTTLTIAEEGDAVVLTQSTSDDKGNSDESTVRADPQTLKPRTGVRTITDPSLKNVVDTTYEDVDAKECGSGRIVRIHQATYKPPTDDKPDSERSNPLCVPEHSYDNDQSLFLWRTIKFEKGYQVTYWTITANRRDKHLVTLTVKDQEQAELADGTKADAWLVEIASERSRQRAWFSTGGDHRLLRYINNQGQVFALMPGG